VAFFLSRSNVASVSHRGFRSATINAVKAATRRSFQIGGMGDAEIASKYNL
jgi:hypothetical protein